MDKWILSRLNSLVGLVTESLDRYDPATASSVIERFVVDDLSQWYLRRSRGRVGPTAEDRKDKEIFYQTMHHILRILCQLSAPFIPYLSEEIYQNLTGEKSVHLSDWPKVDEKTIDQSLEEKMQHLREIVELGHSFRKTNGIALRQPLSKLTVSGFESLGAGLTNVLADELNVKEVVFGKGTKSSVKFDTKLTRELKAEGTARELVRAIQGLRKEKGLKLTDKIEVSYPETPENKLAVALFSDLIRRETLAVGLRPDRILKIRKVNKR